MENQQSAKTIFSFEVFPPKRDMPVETIYPALGELAGLEPDFISVTCGAGGSASGGSLRTIEVTSIIQDKYHREGVVHLPCINFTKNEVLQTLDEMKSKGIGKLLALRGDRVPGVEPKQDFRYARDLISFVREHGDPALQVFAACYPEGHVEAPDLKTDLMNLKAKVDAGADRLISQLFFQNDYFYEFREKASAIGIHVPIEAGIMPVTSKKQIERMVTLCGATLPRKFQRVLAKYESQPEALRDAGIAFAIDQIVDLLGHGVDGIHLYTMNNPYIARRINESIRSLL